MDAFFAAARDGELDALSPYSTPMPSCGPTAASHVPATRSQETALAAARRVGCPPVISDAGGAVP
ncbi:hypothetical protein [Streptomyces sp. NBC_00057]|uniref:hypothetical protein n=1 Tax=Streptomyces sp. NBC_00057 TaxID=2975634 RepID=UPI00325046AD